MSDNTINWDEIKERLHAPFPPEAVQFKVQRFKKGDRSKGQVIPYIDARDVQDRLDDAVGPDNWAFTFTPLMFRPNAENPAKGDEISICQGCITIHGVSKYDVGDAGDTEATKASVSDALKRTAIQWGIGRYLYRVQLPQDGWCSLDEWGKPTAAKIQQFRQAMGGTMPVRSGDNAPVDDGEERPAQQRTSQPRGPQRDNGDVLTEAQRGAILSLGNKAFGRNLHGEMAKLVDKPIAQLTKSEASALIDRLKTLLPEEPQGRGGRARGCEANGPAVIEAPRQEAITSEIATQGQKTLLTTLAREQYGPRWESLLAEMGIPDLATCPHAKALAVISTLQIYRPTAPQALPRTRR